MFDPDVHKALDEQTETFEAITPEGEATAASEALWDLWKETGYKLQELGASPRSMCDTTNQIAQVRANVTERAEERTTS